MDSSAAKEASSALIDPLVAKKLGAADYLITGVVVRTEVSRDRLETLVSLNVGVQHNLEILISDAADMLLGEIVVIDGQSKRLHAISKPLHVFQAVAFVGSPGAASKALSTGWENIGAQDVIILKMALQSASWRKLNAFDKRALRSFLAAKSIGSLGLRSLIALIPLVKDKRNEIVHAAAVAVLEHAIKTGDVSDAGKIISNLPERSHYQMIEWFSKFSPIIFSRSRKEVRSRIAKNRREHHEFKISEAKGTPCFK